MDQDIGRDNKTKYIVVSGGVLSGIGKGVIASSIGVFMKNLGFQVTCVKIDPYLNIDAGTMSPFEHGEVFVLDDGGEVDLDLGNYERFLDITLQRDNNLTTGKIYGHVIERERRGEYLGKTVQVVPHISTAIQDWIERMGAREPDEKDRDSNGNTAKPRLCIIELGGTVGDIESMPFVEAIRQFQFRVGRQNFCSIHVSLIPVIHEEQKSKPTQQGVRQLRALGVSPDVIVCRCSEPINKETRDKVAMFCHVPPTHVISCPDVTNLYQVPLLLWDQKMPEILFQKFEILSPSLSPGRGDLPTLSPSSQSSSQSSCMEKWAQMAHTMDQLNRQTDGRVHIALIGKYASFQDAYLSVTKALQHASLHTGVPVTVDWIDASHLESTPDTPVTQETVANKQLAWDKLTKADGILVPGGFGDRGTEGKITAIQYARQNNVPFLGICLGMQLAVVEFARHVLGLSDANSEEFNPKSHYPVVVYMPEVSRTQMGGTMRLGARKTIVRPDSMACRLYQGQTEIQERHRHRYEVNPKYIKQIEEKGLHFSGQDERGDRMEIVELDPRLNSDHPFFLGVQYHPEFLSRPMRPSLPFVGLVVGASDKLKRGVVCRS